MTLLARLCRDSRAVTAVEFGLLTPVLLTSMLGVFDLGHTLYTNAVLQGAIQKAARDSTIEGAAGVTNTIDAKVEDSVKVISPQATVAFARKSYSNFSDVGLAEDFTDSAGAPDGVCNNGESFEDANGNGIWDSDRGKAGSTGSARDAVLYTVTVSYPRMFPIAAWIGGSGTASTQVSTVLRNQPFGLQDAPMIGNCP